MNKLSNKCTSWCFLDLSVVWHVTELTKWFKLCNLWHGLIDESLFAFHELYDLML